MVGIKVGLKWFEVGSSEFLYSFFSTIVYHLEKGRWGKRFPVLMNQFYKGRIKSVDLKEALIEIAIIRSDLSSYTPEYIIWDLDNLSKQPPWGNDISANITSLANYFVTCNGEDLIGILEEAINTAITDNEVVEVCAL